MKRFLVTILMLVYLSSSVGDTVYRHYCLDRLVAWGVGQEKDGQNTCPYCNMAQTGNNGHCNKQVKGCCHDEYQQVKIEKDQKTVDEGFKLAKPDLPTVTHSPFTFSIVFVYSPALAYPTTHAPPTGKITLFIRNCVFRI